MAQTTGEHPQVTGWYASFLENVVVPNATLFSYLVILGETLVGIALVLGAFTGIAAFFGVFMNASFLFAGTAGANPLMALVAILLVLAWRVAGWWGLDRRILPAIGVPGAPLTPNRFCGPTSLAPLRPARPGTSVGWTSCPTNASSSADEDLERQHAEHAERDDDGDEAIRGLPSGVGQELGKDHPRHRPGRKPEPVGQ